MRRAQQLNLLADQRSEAQAAARAASGSARPTPKITRQVPTASPTPSPAPRAPRGAPRAPPKTVVSPCAPRAPPKTVVSPCAPGAPPKTVVPCAPRAPPKTVVSPCAPRVPRGATASAKRAKRTSRGARAGFVSGASSAPCRSRRKRLTEREVDEKYPVGHCDIQALLRVMQQRETIEANEVAAIVASSQAWERRLPTTVRRQAFRSMYEALCTVHSNRFAHEDKPEEIETVTELVSTYKEQLRR